MLTPFARWGGTGVIMIVDDDPAPIREWLPALAQFIEAKSPRWLPLWLAKPLLGAQGVRSMTGIRGAVKTKAKAELDWKPRYSSRRSGFEAGLSRSSGRGLAGLLESLFAQHCA